MRGHGNVLSSPSSHHNDLSSLHWQKGRHKYDPQVPQEAFRMGKKRRTSQETMIRIAARRLASAVDAERMGSKGSIFHLPSTFPGASNNFPKLENACWLFLLALFARHCRDVFAIMKDVLLPKVFLGGVRIMHLVGRG
jgi:hypothetical protein